MFVTLTVGSACGQDAKPSWRATLKVIDKAGEPVAGATVVVSYYVHPPPGQSEAGDMIQGMTDVTGTFTASQTNTGSIGLSFQASKPGYYTTTKGHEFARFKDNDPAKWNPNETLALKKCVNPIPMYAKFTINLKFPALGTPIGYDLMMGGWVAPYGNGKTADMIFTKEYYDKPPGEYYSKITVSFANRGDGIQEFSAPSLAQDGCSDLRSPHEAPLDGYQSQWIQEVSASPGQPARMDYNSQRNYFFRVQTVSDTNGNVKSALYGKIYGDFMQFRYFLNPTPNDRNIEFDSKQNLLKGLDALHQVSAP